MCSARIETAGNGLTNQVLTKMVSVLTAEKIDLLVHLMAEWKTHAFFGVFFSVAVYLAIRFWSQFKLQDTLFLLFIPLIILYALLPDVDIEGSVIRTFVDFLIVIAFIVFVGIFAYTRIAYYIFMAIAMFLIAGILLTLRHRGKVHSVLAGVLFAAPLLFIDHMLALLCCVAFISHTIIDGEFKII